MALANPLKSKKPLLLLLAVVLTVVSATMTGAAGYTLGGVPLAIGMVIFTVGACILPHETAGAVRSGQWGSAVGMLAITGVFMTAELGGHILVMASVRGGSEQTATVQTVRYEASQDTAAKLKRQLDEATAKLERQATYDAPAAYSDRISVAEAKANLEGTRGGCKDKCLALRAELAKLRADKAIADDRETNTRPLVDRLTADYKEAVAAAAKVDRGFSSAGAHNKIMAELVSFNLNPDGTTKQWTERFIELFMAIAYTFGAAALYFAAQQDWTARKPKAPRPSLIARIRAWYTGTPIEVARPTPAGPPRLVVMDARSAAQHLRQQGMCA